MVTRFFPGGLALCLFAVLAVSCAGVPETRADAVNPGGSPEPAAGKPLLSPVPSASAVPAPWGPEERARFARDIMARGGWIASVDTRDSLIPQDFLLRILARSLDPSCRTGLQNPDGTAGTGLFLESGAGGTPIAGTGLEFSLPSETLRRGALYHVQTDLVIRVLMPGGKVREERIPGRWHSSNVDFRDAAGRATARVLELASGRIKTLLDEAALAWLSGGLAYEVEWKEGARPSAAEMVKRIASWPEMAGTPVRTGARIGFRACLLPVDVQTRLSAMADLGWVILAGTGDTIRLGAGGEY